jgi:hypothetical protein
MVSPFVNNIRIICRINRICPTETQTRMYVHTHTHTHTHTHVSARFDQYEAAVSSLRITQSDVTCSAMFVLMSRVSVYAVTVLTCIIHISIMFKMEHAQFSISLDIY